MLKAALQQKRKRPLVGSNTGFDFTKGSQLIVSCCVQLFLILRPLIKLCLHTVSFYQTSDSVNDNTHCNLKTHLNEKIFWVHIAQAKLYWVCCKTLQWSLLYIGTNLLSAANSSQTPQIPGWNIDIFCLKPIISTWHLNSHILNHNQVFGVNCWT